MTYSPTTRAEFDAYAQNYGKAVDHPLRRVVDRNGRYFVEFKCDEIRAIAAKLNPHIGHLMIADVGCGLGDFEDYLAERFGCLVGVDLSFEMLRVARYRMPLTNGIYVCGSAGQIPLPDASVDMAFASCMFHHMDHDFIVPCLKEMRRITRPGGHIVVFEHNPFNPITQFVVRTTAIDKNAQLVRSSKMYRAFKAAGIKKPQRQYILYAPRGIDQFIRKHVGLLRKIPLGGQYFVVGHTPG